MARELVRLRPAALGVGVLREVFRSIVGVTGVLVVSGLVVGGRVLAEPLDDVVVRLRSAKLGARGVVNGLFGGTMVLLGGFFGSDGRDRSGVVFSSGALSLEERVDGRTAGRTVSGMAKVIPELEHASNLGFRNRSTNAGWQAQTQDCPAPSLSSALEEKQDEECY